MPEVFARQLLLSGIVFPLTSVLAKLSQHSADTSNIIFFIQPMPLPSDPCAKNGHMFILATVTYKARLSGLPAYPECEIHDYHPSRTLRSTSALLLQQQPATVSFAARAFCAAAPTVWNSLGVHTRSAYTFSTFKNRLKTELFKSCCS